MYWQGGREVTTDASGRGPRVRTRSALRSRHPFTGKGVVGKGCPGAAAGWGECSVNLGLPLCAPSPQLLGTQRAERDRSPGSGLAPRWHPFLGKGGVSDQLFGRTDALLHTVSICWFRCSVPFSYCHKMVSSAMVSPHLLCKAQLNIPTAEFLSSQSLHFYHKKHSARLLVRAARCWVRGIQTETNDQP